MGIQYSTIFAFGDLIWNECMSEKCLMEEQDEHEQQCAEQVSVEYDSYAEIYVEIQKQLKSKKLE